MTYKSIYQLFINFLFPKICHHCLRDQPYDYKYPLCPLCLKELEYIDFPYCRICGIFLKNGGELCYNCKNSKKNNFDFCRSVFMFNPVIRTILHDYKYRHLWKLSDWLSDLMVERLDFYKEFSEYKYLIYVPMYKRKMLERGYNQSYLLARNISQKTDKILLDKVLFKIKNTKSQVSLNKKERENNLYGSFSVVNPDMIRGKKIIIIDDVATTLSTAQELAKELKKAGADKISVYTLCRE